MDSDKSLDVLGVKPLGNAVEKVVAGLVDGIGTFLGKICMPAAEEFGLVLRDRVAFYRLKNLAKIVERADELLQGQQEEPTGNANARLLNAVVEEGSWAEDENLQKMWAGLVAGAATDVNGSDDALAYAQILKSLTAFQARVINAVYSDPRTSSVTQPISAGLDPHFFPENEPVYDIREVLEWYPAPLDHLGVIAHTTHDEILESRSAQSLVLGRLHPQLIALKNMDLFGLVTLHDEQAQIAFTPSFAGLDLYMRCLGYRLYPLDAFLLTMQHWSKQKGIDPFKYRT